jgi:hypothetical protein
MEGPIEAKFKKIGIQFYIYSDRKIVIKLEIKC